MNSDRLQSWLGLLLTAMRMMTIILIVKPRSTKARNLGGGPRSNSRHRVCPVSLLSVLDDVDDIHHIDEQVASTLMRVVSLSHADLQEELDD